MLSVIIITKNEALKIRDCLRSAAWADEIIVFDAGSTDDTVAICKEYTDKVFVTDWPGFGAQKNRALAKASHEWILIIDADERISNELQAEIQSTLKNPACNGYYIPMLTYFCGKPVRYGGWYPDHKLRLVKKEKVSISTSLVHENISVTGKTGKLKHHCNHYSHDDLQTTISKMNLYSELAAQQLYAHGKRSSISIALIKGLWAFFQFYVVRAGFLAGKRGVLIAIARAHVTFYKYAKLTMLRVQAQDHK